MKIQIVLKGGNALIVEPVNFYMIKDRFYWTTDGVYYNEVRQVVGLKYLED